MLLAFAGFSGGALVLFVDSPWWTEGPKLTDSGYMLWLLVTLAQTAMWPIAGASVVPILRDLRPHWREARKDVAWSGALLTGFIAVIVFVGNTRLTEKQIVPGYEVKSGVLFLAGYSVVLSAASGIWMIRQALGTFSAGEPSSLEIRLRRRRRREGRSLGPRRLGRLLRTRRGGFLLLKRHLQRLLYVLATILIGIIVGSIAHRRTLVARGFPYPAEWLVVYGGFASALLALVCWPVYAHMLDVGRRIPDARFPVDPLPSPEDLAGWIQRRGALESLLELTGGRSTLGVVGSILAPLASSIVGAALDFL